MAGQHQIWLYDIDTEVAGVCVAAAALGLLRWDERKATLRWIACLGSCVAEPS